MFARAASRYAWIRLFILLLLAGGFVSPALAYNSACSIGIDNATSLSDDSFGSVTRQSMPANVTKSSAITASCAVSALVLGGYQWVLTPKMNHLTQVSGSTSPSVLNAIARSFSLSSTTLLVNNSLILGAGTSAQTTTAAKGTLTGLTSQLTAGTYRLTQTVDVQRQSCTTLLLFLVCSNDGNKQKFTATYTLTVVDQPPPTSGPGSGGNSGSGNSGSDSGAGSGSGSGKTPQSMHKGVVTNPWLVHGSIRSFACAI
jgi:hypothetical protein